MPEPERHLRSPERTRRARVWVLRLGVGALALAAALLVALVGPAAWRTWHGTDDQITIPARVDDLVRDDSPGSRDTIDQLRTAIAVRIRVTASDGAVYADQSGRPRSVIFVTELGSLTSPRRALDEGMAAAGEQAGEVHDVRDMPGGPPGGVIRCGVTSVEGGPMPVCGWADRHSLGIAIFPNRDLEESAALLRTLRHAMRPDG